VGAEVVKVNVTVDISKWKMRDRVAFNEVASTDDSKAIDYIIEHGIVKEWTLPGDPSDREAWLALELEDYGEVIRQIINAAQERFRKSR